MKPERCLTDEDLAELAELEDLADPHGRPDEDPRLDHLAGCVRCRARMMSFRRFMNPSLPASASMDDMTEKLSSEIRQSILGVSEIPSETDGEYLKDRPTLLSSFRRILNMRPVQLGLGFATALFLVVAIRQVWFASQETHAPVLLRGSDASYFQTSNPEQAADGKIRFSWDAMGVWDAMDETVSYNLVVSDTRRNELLRLDANQKTSILLDPILVPGLGEQNAVFLWYIVAIQNGDEVARSSTRSLTLSP